MSQHIIQCWCRSGSRSVFRHFKRNFFYRCGMGQIIKNFAGSTETLAELSGFQITVLLLVFKQTASQSPHIHTCGRISWGYLRRRSFCFIASVGSCKAIGNQLCLWFFAGKVVTEGDAHVKINESCRWKSLRNIRQLQQIRHVCLDTANSELSVSLTGENSIENGKSYRKNSKIGLHNC